ncbi:hypothetical protein C8A01DRAFT_43761 [Parachaetomium inaequale]|uniref:Uncharacterized protein n=1 Tax=Parachaetomium inaequale TaxID=2588326 RepID=A0AAN6PNT5_9PEZI|nr:hypothetical protein C8A01DRAFT_43761 [Parachaetomium inaequale]
MAGRRPIELLPNVVNEVLVTTAKTFRAARRDGKGNPAAAAAAMETRVPASIEKFNAILDEVESDILLTKAVLERDLKLLRAKRQPPPEQKPVAPPAPMVVDLESPKMATKDPFTGLPGPPPPGKQASKPVAPFPNMGFEGTSPEVAAAPNPKTVPKPKDLKNLARPAGAAAAAARPASAPPKKEPKVPPPQAHRPGGVATAPQTPLINPTAQLKASSVPVTANRQTSTAAPGNVPGAATAAAAQSAPATGNGNLFTEMTFSVAPPSGGAQLQNQVPQPHRRASQQQLHPAGTAIPNMGAGEQFTGGPADVPNMGVGVQGGKPDDSSIANVDDKIDGLFDLGPGGIDSMDLEYDLGNGDNSNFNDMYFASGDSNGGTGEFDDAFFNLNG